MTTLTQTSRKMTLTFLRKEDDKPYASIMLLYSYFSCLRSYERGRDEWVTLCCCRNRFTIRNTSVGDLEFIDIDTMVKSENNCFISAHRSSWLFFDSLQLLVSAETVTGNAEELIE